jgi:hypothetical protein
MGLDSHALRLFLQGPLGSSHSDVPYPCGHFDAFGLSGPLEHLPFVVRAPELMLWQLSGCRASRPAFLRGMSLHARMLSG